MNLCRTDGRSSHKTMPSPSSFFFPFLPIITAQDIEVGSFVPIPFILTEPDQIYWIEERGKQEKKGGFKEEEIVRTSSLSGWFKRCGTHRLKALLQPGVLHWFGLASLARSSWTSSRIERGFLGLAMRSLEVGRWREVYWHRENSWERPELSVWALTNRLVCSPKISIFFG